jgi:hypothetical protein
VPEISTCVKPKRHALPTVDCDWFVLRRVGRREGREYVTFDEAIEIVLDCAETAVDDRDLYPLDAGAKQRAEAIHIVREWFESGCKE